jgi:hypothetical protein
MLESMDSFVVEALIANGQVEIFIGLDPTKVTENEYLWKVENVGGIATIPVA